MRMKLRYVVVPIVIIILAALTPFATGLVFKATYLNVLKASQNDKIEVEQYDNGWLTSDIKIHVKFKPQLPATVAAEISELPTGFTVVQHVTHGPYFRNPTDGAWIFAKAAIETQIHLDPQLEAKLLGNRADQGVMQVITLVSFGNNYLSQMQTPVFNMLLTDAAKLSWLGLNGTVSADISGDRVSHVQSDLKIGTLTLKNDANTIIVGASAIQNDITCAENSICTGNQDIILPSITSSNPQSENIKISNFKLAFEGHQSDGKYSNSYQISLKNIVSGENSAGPVDFKLAFNDLNTTEILNLSNRVKEASKNTADPQATQMLLLGELNSEFAKLLTADTAVTANLSVITPTGNLTSSAKLVWPPKTPLPLNTRDIADKMIVRANVRAAVGLVEQFVNAIDEKRKASQPAVATPIPVLPKLDYEPALPNTDEFKNELDAMVQKNLISAEIEEHLLSMQSARLTQKDVYTYLDSLVPSKKLTPMTAYSIKTAYNILYVGQQRAMLINVFSDPATSLPLLADKITMLASMNLISAATAKELIILENQSLAPEIYSVALNKFVVNGLISSDIESQLKAQYAAINKDLALDPDRVAGVANWHSTAPTQIAAVPQRGAAQQELDMLVQKGYLSLDKGDYVANIVYENGVLKINGVTFDP
jgi:uncharacterized protein YdgA (DUF945 family)